MSLSWGIPLFYWTSVGHVPPFGIVIGSALLSISTETASGWVTSGTNQDELPAPSRFIFSADIN